MKMNLKLSRTEFDLLCDLWQKKQQNASMAAVETDGLQAGSLEEDSLSKHSLWIGLQEKGLLDEKGLTKAGEAALEPYRVKRAVILAAGFGSRMMPATADCPKPMVQFRGKTIVETLLDAIVAAGIPEIYLVRGYKGERFDELLTKYPQIQFLENPYYNDANNISTAWVARELIRDAYVCEADLVIQNPAVVRPFEYETNYLGAWAEDVQDWCFWTDEKGYVTKLSDTCGKDCYRMFGISYWTAEDGEKLERYLEEAFTGKKQWKKYWDEISMMDHLEDFSIYVRPCEFADLLEIDTYEELMELQKDVVS